MNTKKRVFFCYSYNGQDKDKTSYEGVGNTILSMPYGVPMTKGRISRFTKQCERECKSQNKLQSAKCVIIGYKNASE